MHIPVPNWLSKRRLVLVGVALLLTVSILVTITRPASAATATIWLSTATPTTASASDSASVELGTKFRSTTAGYITGVRFYKGAANTGTHTGTLWDGTGTQLATVTFTNESASGWQQANFPSPINIAANTTYVISYHAPVGNYAADSSYFATKSATNGPLTALQEGTDGSNGIYKYSASTSFPTDSYQSTNYWVDVVYSDTATTPPDTTPPAVSSASPTSGGTTAPVSSNITATFSEPLTASTVTSTTFTLKTSAGTAVPGTVTYNSGTSTATLDPTTNLSNSTSYTATLTTGVKDAAGNTMAANYAWSFTTAAATPINPLTQGPGGPILVLQNPDLPFSGYASEMLRAEGLNTFGTADLRSLTSATLSGYSVVILGDAPLTSAQVSTLTTWVNGGGNLIAFHPDKQLASLLGLTAQNTTISDAYIGIDTTTTPGNGITDQTIQFHGVADRYALVSGTRAIATLYSNATTSIGSPAVTVRSVGTSGGQAVAFTYDLARSVVYTHQGNPAWSGQERDNADPQNVRPDDLFFGAKTGDVQPDYVDLTKVAIPQADEQQRLLSNIVEYTNTDKTPIPKFWYFPNDNKAVMVMAGDDHATTSGTHDTFNYLLSQSPAGCVVANWTCFRATSYMYATSPMTDTEAASYQAQGFDIGSHVSTDCAAWTPAQLDADVNRDLTAFRAKYPSLPAQTGSRTHCLVMSDYDTTPKVEKKYGLRIDLNYYYWPASWVQNRPGFMTGSGIPMRYTDLGGAMQDVFQEPSDLVNEAGNSAHPANIDTQLDHALGPEGYYGALGTHYDYSDSFDKMLVQSAKARGVPIVSVKQMLDWTDGRNASKFSTPTWSSSTLNFSITADARTNSMLKAMLPVKSSKGILTGIKKSTTAVSYTTEYRKGILYALFPASTGSFSATYAADITAPTVSSTTPASGATNINVSGPFKAVFSEAVDATTINTSTIELRKTSDNSLVTRAVSLDAAGKTATIAPSSPLAGNTGYTLTIKGGTTDPRVKDVSGKALAANKTVTFTTAAAVISLWYPASQSVTAATTDTASVELGTQFSSSQAGKITAIAFYKSSSDPATTHTVTLWNSTGTALATAATTSETASGWQKATFAAPVTIAASTTYTASYRAPNGNYAYTSGYLNTAYSVTPLTVPANGGVYNYGAGVPTSSFSGANYWVDVVYTP
jgi:hypothetical protein